MHDVLQILPFIFLRPAARQRMLDALVWQSWPAGKVILRQRDGGEWRNVSGSSFNVRMYNPRGEEKLNTTIRATDFGAIQFEMRLAKDAALGTWYYYVQTGSAVPTCRLKSTRSPSSKSA